MLHHLEFYVSHLERSREFWGWLLQRLGYARYQEWPQGFSFKFGDTYLVFVQVEDHYNDRPYHRKRVGLNHLAFQAPSTQAVDELAIELRQRGVEILYNSPIADGEHYAVFFEDPDRMKVEFVFEDPEYSET
jgi:catechol 2,3-dioxygenase-like lactoylglutathione lyase family enzyme